MVRLAEAVLKLAGSCLKLDCLLLPADGPEQRLPHVSLVRARLDWEPSVPLTEELNCAVEYFRQMV